MNPLRSFFANVLDYHGPLTLATKTLIGFSYQPTRITPPRFCFESPEGSKRIKKPTSEK